MNTPATQCRRCKKDFSEDNVRYIKVLGTSVPLSHCKECEMDINENYKRYHRENRTKIRIKLIVMLGGKCVCCGEKNWWNIVIDKIKFESKYIRESPHDLYRKLKNNPKLLDEYQCMCWGCDKSKNDGEKCRINHSLHIDMNRPKSNIKQDNFW